MTTKISDSGGKDCGNYLVSQLLTTSSTGILTAYLILEPSKQIVDLLSGSYAQQEPPRVREEFMLHKLDGNSDDDCWDSWFSLVTELKQILGTTRLSVEFGCEDDTPRQDIIINCNLASL